MVFLEKNIDNKKMYMIICTRVHYINPEHGFEANSHKTKVSK
jgi:hypothetical protein